MNIYWLNDLMFYIKIRRKGSRSHLWEGELLCNWCWFKKGNSIFFNISLHEIIVFLIIPKFISWNLKFSSFSLKDIILISFFGSVSSSSESDETEMWDGRGASESEEIEMWDGRGASESEDIDIHGFGDDTGLEEGVGDVKAGLLEGGEGEWEAGL